jgi:hypothetical protein
MRQLTPLPAGCRFKTSCYDSMHEKCNVAASVLHSDDFEASLKKILLGCRVKYLVIILYFSILLHCIVQWVLQCYISVCGLLYCILVFTVFHYMFRSTWPSSVV